MSKDISIYVDGSFSNEKNNYSYGMVCLEYNEIVHYEHGEGKDINAIPLRNVAGEINGAVKAVRYAIDNKYDKLFLLYDYKGIECWANGSWKTNNNVTKTYKKFMQMSMRIINIEFIKIKAHSNDKYNDMADKLAKKALGILK